MRPPIDDETAARLLSYEVSFREHEGWQVARHTGQTVLLERARGSLQVDRLCFGWMSAAASS